MEEDIEFEGTHIDVGDVLVGVVEDIGVLVNDPLHGLEPVHLIVVVNDVVAVVAAEFDFVGDSLGGDVDHDFHVAEDVLVVHQVALLLLIEARDLLLESIDGVVFGLPTADVVGEDA